MAILLGGGLSGVHFKVAGTLTIHNITVVFNINRYYEAEHLDFDEDTSRTLQADAYGKYYLICNDPDNAVFNTTVSDCNAGLGEEIDATGSGNVNGGGNTNWNFGAV